MTPTLAILIPCHGAPRAGIERSLLSLVTQAGDFRLLVHLEAAGPGAEALAPILSGWQARLGAPDTRPACAALWLSYRTRPDAAPAEGLRAGLEHIADDPDRFIGWLRPGDVLLPGALAHVADAARNFDARQLAWLQGAAGLQAGEALTAAISQRAPRELIRQGLCDGLHWPRLAQGGMMFRAGLWHRAGGGEALIGDPDLAEWQLWRRFATQAPLVQSPQPMGLFAQPVEEAPPHRQVRLRRRMAAILPEAGRLAAWRRIVTAGPLIQPVLRDPRPGAALCIAATDITPAARDWARARGLWPAGAGEAAAPQPETPLATCTGGPDSGLPGPLRRDDRPLADLFDYRTLLRGRTAVAAGRALRWSRSCPPHLGAPPRRRDPVWQASRLWAWDQDWDRAERTEWATFRAVRQMGLVPRGTSYAGFPWASLIAARRGGPATGAEARRLEADLDTFARALPFSPRRITACQHPDLGDHLDLLRRAGITDVFWTGTDPDRIRQIAAAGIRVHPLPPCPLGPVPRHAPERDVPRPVLLAGPEAPDEILVRSKFALCPAPEAGRAPRLWRILAAGAVPVFAQAGPETLGLPGPAALWRQGAVFRDPQTGSEAELAETLRAEGAVRDRMETREEALAQIWMALGPEGLAHDIYALMAAHAGQAGAQRLLAAPSRIGRRIRVYHLGPRAARSPLGYAPLARLAEGRVTRAETPGEADVLLTGWNRDLAENPELVAAGLDRNPGLRCMVISEEPLWDTVWSDGFDTRDRPFRCGDHHATYRFLNHVTSGIFDFAHLPYFLLTDDRYIPRYIRLLGQYARMRPRTLLDRWTRIVISAAFVAERRDDPEFDVSDPDRGILGLSRYRSQVAELTEHPKTWRIGKGWPGHVAPRQELPDWHLEKLALLDGRVRLCAAYENTHLRSYVSEKVFDAMAVGAMPVCYAAPDHRLFDLVHPHAMLNTYDQPARTAASWVDWFEPELANTEAWLDSADALRQRLCDAEAVAAERERIVAATLHEIEAFL
ncbi:hypothetical protein JYP51_20040 [Ponticoccus gilvus]|nr:hypothetical protein [Enemella evansiae]